MKKIQVIAAIALLGSLVAPNSYAKKIDFTQGKWRLTLTSPEFASEKTSEICLDKAGVKTVHHKLNSKKGLSELLNNCVLNITGATPNSFHYEGICNLPNINKEVNVIIDTYTYSNSFGYTANLSAGPLKKQVKLEATRISGCK